MTEDERKAMRYLTTWALPKIAYFDKMFSYKLRAHMVELGFAEEEDGRYIIPTHAGYAEFYK